MPETAVPSVFRDVGRLLRRSPKAVWRASVGEAYRKKVDTPKALRERLTVAPVPRMVDPIGTLGHPPRGRRGVKPRHACPHRRRTRILEERLAADAGITLTHRCRDCGRAVRTPVA